MVTRPSQGVEAFGVAQRRSPAPRRRRLRRPAARPVTIKKHEVAPDSRRHQKRAKSPRSPRTPEDFWGLTEARRDDLPLTSRLGEA